jgi:hypothetical protein
MVVTSIRASSFAESVSEYHCLYPVFCGDEREQEISVLLLAAYPFGAGTSFFQGRLAFSESPTQHESR